MPALLWEASPAPSAPSSSSTTSIRSFSFFFFVYCWDAALRSTAGAIRMTRPRTSRSYLRPRQSCRLLPVAESVHLSPCPGSSSREASARFPANVIPLPGAPPPEPLISHVCRLTAVCVRKLVRVSVSVELSRVSARVFRSSFLPPVRRFVRLLPLNRETLSMELERYSQLRYY